MDCTQLFPADFLGKQTITALDDKVVIHYKNLIREFTEEYRYDEISVKTITGRYGDQAWTNLGWYLMGVIIFLPLLLNLIACQFIQSTIFRGILAVLLSLSIISHAMRFIKFDAVTFSSKENDYIFQIKITNKDRAARQMLLDYIKEKVIQQNNEKLKQG
jgi:hypothetical protein